MNKDNINKNSKHPIVSGRILLVGRKWRLFMIDALCYFAVFFTMYGISSIRGNDGSMGVKAFDLRSSDVGISFRDKAYHRFV